MPSITIKNMSEVLYAKLRLTATIHRRSINSKIINCLESVLIPKKITLNERIKRAKWIRSKIESTEVHHQEISKAISEGRP